MPKKEKDELITGKIAAIVTERNAVINRGSLNGVEKEMKFRVVLDLGTISDPDNPDRKLGELAFTKARLIVTNVYHRMSYCSMQVNKSDLPQSMVSHLVNPFFAKPKVESPMLDEDDWRVRVGDEIRQIVPDDEE